MLNWLKSSLWADDKKDPVLSFGEIDERHSSYLKVSV